MRWIWVFVTVAAGTAGDLLSAAGMTQHGEIEDFGPRGIVRVLRYIATHKLVVGGIVCNAISFGSFLALLSTAELSFAVPATALSYIFKTILARLYLKERIDWRRWAGIILITVGVVLISV
ncbi:MAG: DMT family transporter [Acidobacteriaceae bacterium]